MKPRKPEDRKDRATLDKLIEEITLDAVGDDGKFRAFRQALEEHVDLPADGFVIGEPVSVIEIDYDGNERRGLTARCRPAGRSGKNPDGALRGGSALPRCPCAPGQSRL